MFRKRFDVPTFLFLTFREWEINIKILAIFVPCFYIKLLIFPSTATISYDSIDMSIQGNFKINTWTHYMAKATWKVLVSLCPLFLFGTLTKKCASYQMMHYENLPSLFLRGWTNTFLIGAVGDKVKRNGFLAISFCKFSQT